MTDKGAHMNIDNLRQLLDEASPRRNPMTEPLKRVLMSTEMFEQLGASSVIWSGPDKDGFYTPKVTRTFDEEEADRHRREGAREAISRILQALKDYGITPKGRTLRSIQEVHATMLPEDERMWGESGDGYTND